MMAQHENRLWNFGAALGIIETSFWIRDSTREAAAINKHQTVAVVVCYELYCWHILALLE